jgi:hypothetical protein
VPRLALTRAEIAALADKLLAEQGGKCAIRGCTRQPGTRRFHVDHDHRTGQVRGLVCHWHNRIMPRDAREAYALAAYLEAHEERPGSSSATFARGFAE